MSVSPHASRVELWRRLLDLDDGASSCHCQAAMWSATREDVSLVNEVRVIEQDVIRTRAELPCFRSARIRRLLKHGLLRYCAYYRLQYMQGLNEILAPVLAMFLLEEEELEGSIEEENQAGGEVEAGAVQACDSPSQSYPDLDADLTGSLHLAFCFFERIVRKLAPVIFATEGVQALQAQLASFHLLLFYFDAEMAGFLSRESMSTDVYAQSWFITLFARRSPIPIALHVWDLLLKADTPHLLIFLGVALLLHNKKKLLQVPRELIPQTLVGVSFTSEEEIDMLFARAVELEALTPRSAVDTMRRIGFDATLPDKDRAPGLYELMYTPCMNASASDIAEGLMMMSDPLALTSESRDSHDSGQSRQCGQLRYLIIECRAEEDCPSCKIQGSFTIVPRVVDELCKAVDNILSSTGQVKADLSELSHLSGHAALSFLRSCSADDVCFVLCGGDANVECAPSPAMPTGASATQTLASAEDAATLTRNAKRQEAKRAYLLPFNQLAIALLVLGFSRVCVVRGAAMVVVRDDDESLDQPQLHLKLASALRSKTDGQAALLYELTRRGAFVSGHVLRVPQDPDLSNKVAAFAQCARPDSPVAKPERVSRSKSAGEVQATSSTVSRFVETFLLPQMAKTFSSLTSLVTAKPKEAAESAEKSGRSTPVVVATELAVASIVSESSTRTASPVQRADEQGEKEQVRDEEDMKRVNKL